MQKKTTTTKNPYISIYELQNALLPLGGGGGGGERDLLAPFATFREA